MDEIINWDDFLIPETPSLEEERTTSVVMSEYIIKNNIPKKEEKTELTLEELILDKIYYNKEKYKKIKSIKFEKQIFISNLVKLKTRDINPSIYFPIVQDITEIYIIIEKLTFSEAKIRQSFLTEKILQAKIVGFFSTSTALLETLVYIGYFEKNKNINNETIYYPNENFFHYFSLAKDEWFWKLVYDLCKSSTIKECILSQLYNNFDYLTQELMLKKITNDPNIREMSLYPHQKKIVLKNISNWYLQIKFIGLY